MLLIWFWLTEQNCDLLGLFPSPFQITYVLACSLFCHLTTVISVSLQQAMQTMQLFIHLLTAFAFLWSTLAFLPALYHSLLRAVPPTFLLQHPCFCETGQDGETHTSPGFNPLLLSAPGYYSLPWRPCKLPGILHEDFPMQREESGLQGFPRAEAALTSRSTKEMQNWLQLYPLPFQEASPEERSLIKASEKVQAMERD